MACPHEPVRGTTGSWLQVAVGELRVAEVVRVRPGERIPVDGRIKAGYTAVDQAAIHRVVARLLSAPPTLAAIGPTGALEAYDAIKARLG